MSKEAKTAYPMVRAFFGIVAILIIVVAANVLVNSLGVGHKNIDFTKDQVHSVSDGTKSILKDLGSPVTIRYYATRSSDYMPEQIKLHMRRVDDLLAEYANLSGGKVRIENLDPEPDTDAEDSAQLDGINGQQINDQNLYFGLAISCLDRTATIPFLNPQQETMLEYELSRSISEVSRPDKPVIGLMSALPVSGSQGNPMMGQRGAPPWVIFQQLKQSYDIRDLSMTPEKIDPEIDLLLLLHPAQITPEAEFAIDQYVLQGGTVVACVDPYSVVAESLGGGNPMMGGGTPRSSNLPTLMPAWGVTLNTEVLADGLYGLPNYGPLLPQFPADAMPDKTDIITKNLREVMFYLPGGFTVTGSGGVKVDTLIKSSQKAALITPTPTEASRPSPAIASKLRPTGQSYPVVVHLSGSFKSAFPKGKPGTAEGEKKEVEAKEGETKPEEAKKADHLTEATKTGHVFLISDLDAFYDQIAYQVQRLGNMQLAQPQNGNSVLLFNIIDQALSSPHLIGSRSRAAVARPFVKFDEMEQASEEKTGIEEKKFEDEAADAEKKINEIQALRGSNDGRLTPEQTAEIAELRKKKVESDRKKRDLQKELRREKDRLAGNVTLLNFALMPAIVVLLGGAMLLKRRFSWRAR